MTDMHLRYAEEVAVLGGIKSPSLRRVLAIVRREDFLPPGPWIIESLEGHYYLSDNDQVSQILHGVGVAIDPARMLNNANPVRVCNQWQAVDIQPGETVFHVGAGVGYYSALLAELVGPNGRVIAAEIDEPLRQRARQNLTAWPQVEVIGDALGTPLPGLDVIYASAGFANIPRGWIDALRPGGRMILPMTGPHDHGGIFLFRKVTMGGPLAVTAQSFTRHFPCIGARRAADLDAIANALNRPLTDVASLRLDPHEADETCWLHHEDWCLSSRKP
jgi:protein-L-isoaspartate(D-aspartate) O-methyltransferase